MSDDGHEHGDCRNRRRFLKLAGSVGVAGLAGCSGDGDNTAEPTDGTEQAATTRSDTATVTETETETVTEAGTPTPPGTSVEEQPIENPVPLLNLDDGGTVQPGTMATLSGTVTNDYLFDVRNVEITLEASGDATVTPVSETSIERLETQAQQQVEWELMIPDSADDEIDLTATVVYESTTDRAEAEVTGSLSVTGPVSIPYGLNAGGTDPVEYDGVTFDYYNATDGPDPAVALLFEEGEDSHSESSANPEGYSIEGTEKDDVYNTMMWGDDIGYEITVPPGTYDVTLHLAEINFESEGQRVQSVSVQGETVFEELDLVARAGYLTALTETVEVGVDGEPILIESEVIVDQAEDEHSMFNAVEIREA
jgi:hypothetical protein